MTQPKQALAILVVDDDDALRKLLIDYLTGHGLSVTGVGTATEAVQAVARQDYSLVLLDLNLPDGDGIDLARKWRAEANIAIICLTGRLEEADRVMGLELGADDYITKPFSPRELLARARALLRRKSPELAETQLKAGPVVLDPVSCTVSMNENKIDIGHAEYKLLKFFMAHPERVFSRSQLLDKVWGDHVVIEERTVDVHVLRLRKALKDAEHLIKTVRSVGYMLTEKP